MNEGYPAVRANIKAKKPSLLVKTISTFRALINACVYALIHRHAFQGWVPCPHSCLLSLWRARALAASRYYFLPVLSKTSPAQCRDKDQRAWARKAPSGGAEKENCVPPLLHTQSLSSEQAYIRSSGRISGNVQIHLSPARLLGEEETSRFLRMNFVDRLRCLRRSLNTCERVCDSRN